MPSSIIKSYAEQSKKSEVEVEKIWNEVKQTILMGKKFKEDSHAFWAYLNAAVRKRLGLAEEKTTFKQFTSNPIHDIISSPQ